MCEVDYDPCEVWVVTTPTARKSHRCDCCAGVIPPGVRYTRTFSICEGAASTGKHCAACEREMARFAAAHAGARMTPGGFTEMVSECIYEGDGDDARRWKAMLARIRRRAPAAA